MGELAGVELERYPANIVAYGDFRDAHPDGRVLSRETGTAAPYGRNPYRGYDSIDDQPFSVLLTPWTRVYPRWNTC